MSELNLPEFICKKSSTGECYRGPVHLEDFGGHYLIDSSSGITNDEKLQTIVDQTIIHFEKQPTPLAKLTCAYNTYNIRENSNSKCVKCIHWDRIPDSSYSACYDGYCGNHNKINRGILSYIERLLEIIDFQNPSPKSDF